MANGKALVKAPVNTLEVLREALAVPGQEIAKLHDLLDFQIRFEAREAEKSFHADYALANLEMPRITKDGVIDMGAKGKIPFAKYETLDKVIKPIENKYGFTRMFLSEPATDGIKMILVLSHRDGHSIRSERWHPPDPGPGRNGLQAMGSAGSFARRYLTQDIWNIVTVGADDDATSSECISKEQVKIVNGLLQELKIVEAVETIDGQLPELRVIKPERFGKFLVYAGANSVEGIQKQNYQSVLARLRTAHTKEVDL